MSANVTETTATNAAAPPVPKRITNAQTVCNERNEKNKLCNGHLKQLKTAGELADVHLRGDDVLYKCQICATLYMGPPLGHVRDPEKQSRFVEHELAALLQAAGGTMPVIKKNDRGVYVIVEPEGAAPAHGAPAAKPAAAPKAATPPVATPKPSASAAQAGALAEKAMAPPPAVKPTGDPDRTLNTRSTYSGFKDTGPVAGESKEQKIARLTQLAEAVKRQRAEGGAPEPASATVVDSSPTADAHRPAAEAQAATGAASAAPLSEAAASASPVAGAETPSDLAPDSVAPATQPTATASHAPAGDPDRSLMTRGSYAGVVDTGPVPGETREQKIERLAAIVEAVKQQKEG
ncbi:MAG TPA: hypothetical protein VJV21_02720 [Pyrinomonadaceae bacterium]|nr:hypothetical protein [Pyrinomonadaceae bacterium]